MNEPRRDLPQMAQHFKVTDALQDRPLSEIILAQTPQISMLYFFVTFVMFSEVV